MGINQEKLKWFQQVRSILESGSTVEFAPLGYSMWPTIRPKRDVVRVAKADVYGKSDIVLAISDNPEGVFLHRIVGIGEDKYILMGDSNLFQQEVCSHSQVIGRAVEIGRDGRNVIDSATNRMLRGIYILPPAVRRCFVRMVNLLNREIPNI